MAPTFADVTKAKYVSLTTFTKAADPRQGRTDRLLLKGG
jgi:hypothetical protein